MSPGHRLRDEETDLSFADIGTASAANWLYAAPALESSAATKEPAHVTSQTGSHNLERETGFEPATLSLGS